MFIVQDQINCPIKKELQCILLPYRRFTTVESMLLYVCRV